MNRIRVTALAVAVLALPAASPFGGATSDAKTRKRPPWAGKTYHGSSQLQTGQKLGAVTLKVARDGKSLTYTVPWTCDQHPQTSTHKVAVRADGSFKGGVNARSGNPGISFFVRGSFTGRNANKAHGDLFGAIRVFEGPEEVSYECETGNVANPGIVWSASR